MRAAGEFRSTEIPDCRFAVGCAHRVHRIQCSVEPTERRKTNYCIDCHVEILFVGLRRRFRVDVLGGRDQLARVADRAEALVRAAGPAIERGQNLLGVRDGETARFGAVNVERRCTYIRDVFRWGGDKG